MSSYYFWRSQKTKERNDSGTEVLLSLSNPHVLQLMLKDEGAVLCIGCHKNFTVISKMEKELQDGRKTVTTHIQAMEQQDLPTRGWKRLCTSSLSLLQPQSKQTHTVSDTVNTISAVTAEDMPLHSSSCNSPSLQQESGVEPTSQIEFSEQTSRTTSQGSPGLKVAIIYVAVYAAAFNVSFTFCTGRGSVCKE